MWKVNYADKTTGASIEGNTLKTTGAGEVIVKATIVNGKTESTDFTNNAVITVTPVYTPHTNIHPVCGLSCTHTSSHADVTYTELTQRAIGGTLRTGNYYLDDNLTAESNIFINGDVNLCLNGYTLNMQGYKLIQIGGTLNLSDCKTGGKILRSGLQSGSLLQCGGYSSEYTATLNLYGGTLESQATGTNGMGVTALSIDERSTANLYGGAVTQTNGKPLGDAISNSGTLNLYGGTVSNPTGVAIFTSGSLTLSGSPTITPVGGQAHISVYPSGNTFSTIHAEAYTGEQLLVWSMQYNLNATPVVYLIGTLIQCKEDDSNRDKFTVSVGKFQGIPLTVKPFYDETTHAWVVRDVGDTPATTYTVTFNSDGGTPATATKTVTAPATTVGALPGEPARAGYVFGGWFTAKNGGGTEFTLGTTVSGNLTVYAKWTERVFSVSGNITDNNDASVAGATVTIKRGNTEKSGITDALGVFTIADIPNGVYQLIITSDGLTVTRTITVNSENLAVGTVKLPAGKQNSVVVVMPNTPDIVVGGLDEQFEHTATDNDKGITEEDKTVIADGGEVELELTVKSADDTAPKAAEIKQAAGGKTLVFLDLSVKKTVTPKDGSGTETPLTELQKPLDTHISLTADQQGKSDYTVYRHHGDKVDTITTTANADGEKLELIDGGKTLLLWTKKFSTYAMAYSEPTPPSGGSAAVTSYAITATAGEGGSISPQGNVRVNRNDSQTFTVKADAGYEIADVLVDGERVGAVATYTFEKVTARHTIEAQFRKEAKNSFTDVNEENWFYDAVLDMCRKGILEGTTSDKFSPYLNTDRATMVAALWRMAGSPSAKAASTFPDVPADAWYAAAVAWGAEKGIVKGYGNGSFGPDDLITREQMATILWRYTGSEKVLDYEGTGRFTDTQDISPWASYAVTWALSEGILTGKGGGLLDPGGEATRAEAAVMLARFLSE